MRLTLKLIVCFSIRYHARKEKKRRKKKTAGSAVNSTRWLAGQDFQQSKSCVRLLHLYILWQVGVWAARLGW
ncbi:hypothetical protein LX36DRAFT_735265 [Colletotrichum falcatum]|nr:hypothetical protein LX36DRAFT_735265 [Colletotrichum falcatum]